MKAIYPNYNGTATFSQGERDTPSHQGQYALDYMMHLYAPFDMKKVGDSRWSTGHQQYFESVSKIELPNGKTDYISFMVEHSNDNIPVGKTWKKNQLVTKMGNTGTTATHLHVVVGQGKVNKSKIGQFGRPNSAGFYETLALNVKSAKDLFYKPNRVVWNYESNPVAFKPIPKEQPKTTYDVWTVKNQNGATVYFYAQSFKDGKELKNNLDNDDDNVVYYYPKGYHSIKTVQKTYLYRDKKLSKKFLNKKGNHTSIPKGKYVVAKYVGKMTK